MKKTITFGGISAELNAGKHRAALSIGVDRLPLELADAINEAGDIRVNGVMLDDNETPYIRMTHDLDNNELLAVITEAITRVYDTDIVVSNATTAPTV